MIINETKLIEIFIEVDDFCKSFKIWEEKRGIGTTVTMPVCGVKSKFHPSESMTIMILYHLSGYKCFEYFYSEEVLKSLKSYFPYAVCYERFVARIPETGKLMFLFSHYKSAQSERTGIYFVDSKRIEVCHVKREKQNCVFKNIATKGKSSMGWFYGLKVHIVINNIGQIVHFAFSQGNIADNNANILKYLFGQLTGKCVGDKGYLTKLFDSFLGDGLQLITKIKKNMKNVLMPMMDKLLLRKRGVIESVNDILISICDLEHSRHRSAENAFSSMFAALSAYAFLDRKPSIATKKLIANS